MHLSWQQFFGLMAPLRPRSTTAIDWLLTQLAQRLAPQPVSGSLGPHWIEIEFPCAIEGFISVIFQARFILLYVKLDLNCLHFFLLWRIHREESRISLFPGSHASDSWYKETQRKPCSKLWSQWLPCGQIKRYLWVFEMPWYHRMPCLRTLRPLLWVESIHLPPHYVLYRRFNLTCWLSAGHCITFMRLLLCMMGWKQSREALVACSWMQWASSDNSW